MYTREGSNHTEANNLFEFVGIYMLALLGTMNMWKELRQNRGKPLIDMDTLTLFVHDVTTLENHVTRWTQTIEVKELDKVKRGRSSGYTTSWQSWRTGRSKYPSQTSTSRGGRRRGCKESPSGTRTERSHLPACSMCTHELG